MPSVAKKAINSFFNPFASSREDRLFTAEDPVADAFVRAGGIGVGTAGLAYVIARALKEANRPESDRKAIRRIKDAVNAKYPVYSLDPDTADIIEEEALQDVGVPKTASERFSNLDIPLILAAIVAGGIGGSRLADKHVNATLAEAAKKKAAQIRNETDALVYSTHDEDEAESMNKSASDGANQRLLDQVFSGVGKHVNQASDFMVTRKETDHGPIDTAVGIGLTGGLATAALAYLLSKEHFTRNDPARMQRERLLQALDEESKIRAPPVFIDITKPMRKRGVNETIAMNPQTGEVKQRVKSKEGDRVRMIERTVKVEDLPTPTRQLQTVSPDANMIFDSTKRTTAVDALFE